jgi:hypothetical protein
MAHSFPNCNGSSALPASVAVILVKLTILNKKRTRLAVQTSRTQGQEFRMTLQTNGFAEDGGNRCGRRRRGVSQSRSYGKDEGAEAAEGGRVIRLEAVPPKRWMTAIEPHGIEEWCLLGCYAVWLL